MATIFNGFNLLFFMVFSFKILNKKKSLIVIAIFAFIPLLFAYIAEYIFDINPCNLCLWQRKPLIAIFFISIIAMIWKKGTNIAIKFSIILITVNIIISFYHIGVENGIFTTPKSCENSLILTQDIKKLEKIIKKTPAVKCDQPIYIFGKISIALANFIYSVLFLAFLIYLISSPIFNRKNGKNF